ncbi:MAG: hypothetical protein WC136_01360 [Sphaerochaeta sp.]|jgi:hypothetical protein
MTVNELIEHMESVPDDYKIKLVYGYGVNQQYFTSDFITDSWRGSYNLPATEFGGDDTLLNQINNLKATHGKRVRGGNYILDGDSTLFFVECWDESGDCVAVRDVQVDHESEELLFFLQDNMY